MINKLAHLLIGAAVGAGTTIPKYRTSAVVGGSIFAIYEVWESVRIGDSGWREIREFGVGFIVGILVEKLLRRKQ